MQHGCACAAVLLALLVVQATSSAFVANPAEHLSHAKRAFLERLYSAQLALPEKLIRHGQKFDIDGGRQWHRLLEKLQSEGSTVNIVVYGGSVSVSVTCAIALPMPAAPALSANATASVHQRSSSTPVRWP